MTIRNSPNWENKATYQQMYHDLLVKPDTTRFHRYFNESCYININGKEYDSHAFQQRMRWLKAHATVDVEVINFFVSKDGTKITDTHVSYSLDKYKKKRVFRVMQQSELSNGRICRFIDNTYILNGDDSDYNITTHK